MSTKIGIIDIETTGFLNQGGKIVEVGIVSLDTVSGETEVLFDSLCREDGMTAKDREAWIFQNSDLKVEEVRDAKNFLDIKAEIQRVVSSLDACTAFNKSFDFDFLRSRGVILDKECECPMRVATNICKLESRGGRSGFKWPKVEEAWQHFFPEIHYVEKHRAADDALHEAKIVFELHKMGLMGI